MKYILQVKTQGEPTWTDFKISKNEEEIEKEFKEKVKHFPLNNLRIVKEVTVQTDVYVRILD